MQFLKSLAAVAVVTAGALGYAGGSASASPLMPVGSSATGSGLVSTVQVYEVRPRRYVAPPVYRRAYRPAPYRAYRPVRRTVCYTQVRTVRTAYGRIIRRPVEVCRTR